MIILLHNAQTEHPRIPLLIFPKSVQTSNRLFPGKNVRRSIHGVGQMMSTMVLSRKQSIFPGSGRPGDSQAGSKDSIDTQDITVMDTKLKILEILQVRWRCVLDNYVLCVRTSSTCAGFYSSYSACGWIIGFPSCFPFSRRSLRMFILWGMRMQRITRSMKVLNVHIQ